MADDAENESLAQCDVVGQILSQGDSSGSRHMSMKLVDITNSKAESQRREKTVLNSKTDKTVSNSKADSRERSDSKADSRERSESHSHSKHRSSSSRSDSKDTKELMGMMASSLELLSKQMTLMNERQMKETAKRSRDSEQQDSENECSPPKRKSPPCITVIEDEEEDEEPEEQDVMEDIQGLIDEEGEITEEMPEEAEDLDFLDQLAQDFEVEDKVGPEITEKIATIVKSSFTKKLAQEKMKALQESYQRPKNCDVLAPVKVNPEIWAKMKPDTRNKDLELQKIQMKLCKTAAALSEVADSLLSDKTANKKKIPEYVKHIMDSVAMVGAATQDLHVRRREQIKPDLNVQYRSLCSAQVPVTSHLFGDDLAKTLKDINETCRVGAQVSKENRHSKGGFRNGSKGKYFLDKRKPHTNHKPFNNYRSGYNYKSHNSSYKNPKKTPAKKTDQ